MRWVVMGEHGVPGRVRHRLTRSTLSTLVDQVTARFISGGALAECITLSQPFRIIRKRLQAIGGSPSGGNTGSWRRHRGAVQSFIQNPQFSGSYCLLFLFRHPVVIQ